MLYNPVRGSKTVSVKPRAINKKTTASTVVFGGEYRPDASGGTADLLKSLKKAKNHRFRSGFWWRISPLCFGGTNDLLKNLKKTKKPPLPQWFLVENIAPMLRGNR